MKKISFAFICTIAATIVGLQFDDSLDPAVHDLLSKVEIKQESNAYLYLLGISAPEKEDPFLIGQKIFAAFQEDEEKFFNKKTNPSAASSTYRNSLSGRPLPHKSTSSILFKFAS